MSNSKERVVGYVRTLTSTEAGKVQENMIRRYCDREKILCNTIYSDYGYSKRRARDIWRARQLGVSTARHHHTYNEWEEMLVCAMHGEIETILVDNRIRLYSNEKEKIIFESICQRYGIRVIEVAPDNEPATGCQRVAVYHFTNVALKRPAVVLNEIDKMYTYASRHGWEVVHTYLDLSMLKGDKIQLEQLKETLGDYEIVLVMNYCHIEKKMTGFCKQIQRFKRAGVRLISMDEGELCLYEEDILKSKMCVAVYDSVRNVAEDKTRELLLERITTFTKCRAPGWRIKRIYLDGGKENKGDQLQQLIKDAAQYDLILMDTYAKIHNGTNQFYKFKNRVKVPLFSLREGAVL